VRTDLEKALKCAPHALGVTEAAVKRRIRMGFFILFSNCRHEPEPVLVPRE
jgi:hypothetical protein